MTGTLVYIERWFTSLRISDHLWALTTKAGGKTVMANRKEMPKLYFSKKIRQGEKVYLQINQLLVIKF
jgi:hypothetical protein